MAPALCSSARAPPAAAACRRSAAVALASAPQRSSMLPARSSLGSSATLRGGSALPAATRSSKPSRGSSVAVQASWNRNSSPEIADRVVASLPFLVPLLDGLRYGKFFLTQFPQFATLLVPLEPLIRLYYSTPFTSLIVFFAIYLGIINNQNFSRYVRFHAMQAVLLDIILILPGLLESVVRPPMGGPGLQVYITIYNTIFLFLFACVAYGAGSCLAGQTARLPLVADAADMQVR